MGICLTGRILFGLVCKAWEQSWLEAATRYG